MEKNKNAKMKFYNIQNYTFFLSDIIYWKGANHIKNFRKIRYCRCNTPKKLSQCDEFLLTLMRLRLRLLNEDLAETFGVSPTLCLYIFTALVVWPPKGSTREYLYEIFLKSGCRKCRVIIDCAELFIESPKSLSSQAATWPDYNHHNTFKCLVKRHLLDLFCSSLLVIGVPAKDKFITIDTGFYDLLGKDDEVMADRGFQI